MTEQPTLQFLAKQVDRLQMNIGSMRDEMRVQSAITQRLDATIGAVLLELRESHIQAARHSEWLRRLAEAVEQLAEKLA